jgi:hypothetical protein
MVLVVLEVVVLDLSNLVNSGGGIWSCYFLCMVLGIFFTCFVKVCYMYGVGSIRSYYWLCYFLYTELGVFSVVLCRVLLYIWCWWYKQLLWRVCYILWSILLQEFYRFVPNDRPKLQIFPQKGIKVEVGSLHVCMVFGTKKRSILHFYAG